MTFRDRTDAGQRLANRLLHLRHEPVVVLGLPRGGVPVAYHVARALQAPLDIILVRKLGVPGRSELGMGAIGEGDVRIIDREVFRLVNVTARELAAVEATERLELERRARRFRGHRSRVPLEGRTAVIVDDGVATGSTARAACKVARAHGAARVVLAVPVAPPGWEARIGGEADELIALETPGSFFAIGQAYDDFSQTSDEEVNACLEGARAWAPPAAAPAAHGHVAPRDEDVAVPAGAVLLEGHLTVPENAVGMVVFAHGSGSSRHSPRNRHVAAELNRARIGTLLLDLLTVSEERYRANVFDVGLLGRRLVDVTRWLRGSFPDLPIGYFGASTGAAAALWAASQRGADVRAVVSRGGRPDLAGHRLAHVQAPTLLIVGGLDPVVVDLNREAEARLRGERRLAVVRGATHLFEEPGALDVVARLATDWFLQHLAPTEQAVSWA